MRILRSGGQLTASGATAYVYDAEGRRVMKGTISGTSFTPSEQYLLDLGGEQVSVLDGSGNWQRTNVYATGKLLATYDGKGTHFALSDWLGTKRMQLSAGGTIEEQCMSLPYGDGLGCSGPSPDANTHHFTGKEHDFESGLDYFGARYYGSTAGRFMIPDWSKNPQGVPYATYANPQSLNLYEYVGNNPLSRVDPNGHDYICFPCLATASKTAIATHPRTAQALKGVGKVVLGVSLGATIDGGDVPGSAAGVVMAASGLLGATSTAVSGTVDIGGAAANTDVSAATQGLAATSTFPGLITTAVTGNLQAGSAVSTLSNAAQLASKPQAALKNGATMADAVQTLGSATGLVRSAASSTASAIRGALAPSPTPPPRPIPSVPNCGEGGPCSE